MKLRSAFFLTPALCLITLHQTHALTFGDFFGPRTWVVVGIMNSDGTTFGSEVWTKRETVSDLFNRKGYTSLVLRVEDEGTREETAERARIFADHMRRRFTNPKVNAFTETEYFARLSQGNTVFVVFTLAVALRNTAERTTRSIRRTEGSSAFQQASSFSA